MKRTIAPLLALAALAGCSGQSTNESAAATGDVSLTNAAPSEVAAQTQAAGTMRFNPGQWETRVQLIDVNVPGLPAGAAEQMKKVMEATTTHSSCVTPEQAANPGAEVFAGSDGQCRYENFTMANGRIDAKMVCAGTAGSGEMRMQLKGSFDRTTFTMQNEMVTNAPGGGQAMTMKARVSGRRTGECQA